MGEYAHVCVCYQLHVIAVVHFNLMYTSHKDTVLLVGGSRTGLCNVCPQAVRCVQTTVCAMGVSHTLYGCGGQDRRGE